MQKLVWQNSNGDVIDLTSGNYAITNWEGFSNTSLNIQSQQVPFQDGGVFLDALMEQRELAVTLAMQDNNDLEERYRMRRELIHILNPKLGEGYLIYKNDFTEKRIKCVAQIPLFETHNSNDIGTPKASLAWTACEPYWEDLEETSQTINYYEKPIIKNEGDVKAQVKMEILPLGTVANPTIVLDDKKITYNGSVSGGERITINTNNGIKSVTKGGIGYNVVSENDNFTYTIYSERLGMFFGITPSLLKTSYDGINWNIVNYGEILTFDFIKEVNGYIYVTFRGAGFFRSADGVNWEKGYVYNILKATFFSLAYSPDLDLYVGSVWVRSSGGNTLLTSQDGFNWVSQSLSVFSNIRDIVWNDNIHKFIAVGNFGLILSSVDGFNWIVEVEGGHDSHRDLCKIVYSKKLNIMITVDRTRILTSSDGTEWTNRAEYSNALFNDILMSELKDVFVCIDYSDSSYVTSANGTDWERTIIPSVSLETGAITYSLGAFIYGSDSSPIYQNLIYHSSDYNNFSLIKNEALKNIMNIFNVNDILFAVGNKNIYYTKNLKDFVTVSFDFGTSSQRLLQVAYIHGKYVVLFRDFQHNTTVNRVYVSENLKDWNITYEAQDVYFCQILYVPQKNVILIRCYDCVLKSEDLINWEVAGSFPDGALSGMTYYNKNDEVVLSFNNSGSMFGGKIATSQDLVNWTEHQIAELGRTRVNTDGYSPIQYFPDFDIFLFATGETSCQLLYGKDYINWQNVYSTYSVYNGFSSLIFSKEYNSFIATEYSGLTIMSIDGYNWQQDKSFSASHIVELNNTLLLLTNNNIMTEEQQKSIENVISNLSADSDMSMALEVGENLFKLSATSGMFNIILKYRQRYIGV